MIESLVQPASTYASEIDFVINLVGVSVGFWFFVTLGAFFWLLWRFRWREGVPALYVTGTEPELKRFITWPHYIIILLDVFIIVAAVRVWYMVKQDQPPAEDLVRVVAQQWAWTFVHAGPDGKLDTEDDIKTADELHVEVGKVYHFELESRDVLHDFSVPVFRLKQDAIPGRRINGWFEPTIAGKFDIQCAEICGIGHGLMAARIIVETPEEHAAWLANAAVAH
jgi:cytochrome c oxidase subunit 2